jgi:hypothetical protein
LKYPLRTIKDIYKRYAIENLNWRNKERYENNLEVDQSSDCPWSEFEMFVVYYENVNIANLNDQWNVSYPSDNINNYTSVLAQIVLQNFYRIGIKTNSIEQLYDYIKSFGYSMEKILEEEYKCINIIMIKTLRVLHDFIVPPEYTKKGYMNSNEIAKYLENRNCTLEYFINAFAQKLEETPKKEIFCRAFPMLRNRKEIQFPAKEFYFMSEVVQLTLCSYHYK